MTWFCLCLQRGDWQRDPGEVGGECRRRGEGLVAGTREWRWGRECEQTGAGGWVCTRTYSMELICEVGCTSEEGLDENGAICM